MSMCFCIERQRGVTTIEHSGAEATVQNCIYHKAPQRSLLDYLPRLALVVATARCLHTKLAVANYMLALAVRVRVDLVFSSRYNFCQFSLWFLPFWFFSV